MAGVLGDFLDPAAGHITAATASGGKLPKAVAPDLAGQLGRVVVALSHYLADLALPDGADPVRPSAVALRMAVPVRLALRRSALLLGQAAGGQPPEGVGDAHPVVAHLAAAAGYLSAGRDTLQARRIREVSPVPELAQAELYWAAMARSPAVTAALLAEVTGHARTLAPWAARLSRAMPGTTGQALHDAARWLYAAAGTAGAGRLQDQLPAGHRQLLCSIPGSAVRPRRPPAPGEPVPDLCAGITDTADRLRRAIHAAAPLAAASGSVSSLTWRRHALAAAIATHNSTLILRGIAGRAHQLDAPPALCTQLTRAANAAEDAWPLIRAISRRWDVITTASRNDAPAGKIARELDDMVLRIGRIAFRNPAWAPGMRHAAIRRSAGELAPASEDLTMLIGSLHQAADATALAIAADRQLSRGAGVSGRFLVPAHLIACDGQAPYNYAPCPARLLGDLATGYNDAATASQQLTAALDDLADTCDLPSKTLAAPRQRPLPEAMPAPAGCLIPRSVRYLPALSHAHNAEYKCDKTADEETDANNANRIRPLPSFPSTTP
ncbi:MAG TPA: hypothetical protein VGG25_02745 [Streptosporangiaceae bacterium]|jgi:hypothetical protein